jgi:hypothetical protein
MQNEIAETLDRVERSKDFMKLTLQAAFDRSKDTSRFGVGQPVAPGTPPVVEGVGSVGPENVATGRVEGVVDNGNNGREHDRKNRGRKVVGRPGPDRHRQMTTKN